MREIDSTVDTTQTTPILSGFHRGARFDDRIDPGPEISNVFALKLVLRGLRLLSNAKGLFAAKFSFQIGMIIPGLFVAWFAKIVIDYVISQKELVAEEARFPPHMDFLIRALEGLSPMEIMAVVTGIYCIGLFLIGTRTEQHTAETFRGSDPASNAENEISEGWSSAGGLLGLIDYWVSVRLNQRIGNTLRTQLFARLSHSSVITVDDNRVGDSLFRVMYDSVIAWGIIGSVITYPFFTFVGYGVLIYQLKYTYEDVAPELIWIAWIMMPTVFLVTLPLIKLKRRTVHNSRASSAAMTNSMEEMLNNIHAVQSLGGMDLEKGKYADRSAHAFWRGRVNLLASEFLNFVYSGSSAVIGIVIAIFVSNEVITEVLTVGDFFALFTLYMGIAGTAAAIGDFWINLQDRLPGLRRVIFFIDHETDEERYRGTDLGTISKGVKFENVDFAYPDGTYAVRDINLDLPIGSLVAVVGPTGAGKTSLAYLIPAFLRPTRGSVTIDGIDIEAVNLPSLRKQVSFVFQEHQLLSESIRENLLMANSGTDEEGMLEALNRAGCMEFITELPDGIDTVLGRTGDTLSVGQQQRLSIARGLIRDTPILILDEPTAALDPRTEHSLMSGLREACQDKLVIVIAHRLSTVRYADLIVFVEDGSITDLGNHEELMAKPESRYRRFVELQGSSGIAS